MPAEEGAVLSKAIYSWNNPSATINTNVVKLKPGDRVHHEQFGDGVVVSCLPVQDDDEVVVAFSGLGVKKLLISFAGLEKSEKQ